MGPLGHFGSTNAYVNLVFTRCLLTCHDGIIEIFSCRVKVDDLNRTIDGLRMLDHGRTICALHKQATSHILLLPVVNKLIESH